MPLEVTPRQAELLENLRRGNFHKGPLKGYKKNPEHVKKDREIAKLLMSKTPISQIIREQRVGDYRINRILKEMFEGEYDDTLGD
jgi:hypothetical protein